ncbi:hypothetical protein EHN07_19095 [Buttiauxella warmboldiae]|uniref:Uncharacterized protein n=1 Tax=Buttiauxella warmboldiae TaxID=82993 RepID=A0A3N5DWA6_9ENTR|nr:hypothetical protein [Buttiauxella warmboldiae]RPH20928.1 hypothetical protein EHN07_19095 [Buttiauxella warmboldiae]
MNYPTLRYYDLSELTDPFSINEISNATLDQLDRGNVESIAKALYTNTKICVNGVPFIKVKGIADIIRTGNSGLERALIYQGIPGFLPRSEIVSIDGFDHISGHSLCAILDSRIGCRSGKTKQYLKIALNLYFRILNSGAVRDLKEMFLEEIEQKRSTLKNERIRTYNITQCEFTGRSFGDSSLMQFAHIDSVVYNPSTALDINNGVIIFRDIHADMTRRGINTYEETYSYCEEHGYFLDWAD